MAIFSIRPGDSSHLQSALHASQPGDEIVPSLDLPYVGTFDFPPKAGRVTFRSPVLLDHFIRVTPADAARMPTLKSGSSGRAINGIGAKNWAFHGIRFEANVGGFGEVLGFENAESIHMECILLVVPEGQQQKRGILGNGRNITLTRSHLSGIWRSGQDSQAFAAWDDPGPYTITDNYLEAASENVLFGGSDASSAENIPADIRIEGNTFSKNLAWKGQPRQVKNLLELKCAKRVLIRGNTFEHNWADAQSGRAILFTPRNQDGTAPFSVIEDVTFEQNVIRDVPMVFNIAGYDDLNPSGQTTRIVIRDNDIQTAGMPFLIHNECGRVEIYRNKITMPPDNPLVSLGRGQVAISGNMQRPASWAVDDLVFAETESPGSYIHSPNHVGIEAFRQHTGETVFTVPSDAPAPLPALPAPVDGLPVPTPGTQIDAPSIDIVANTLPAQVAFLTGAMDVLIHRVTQLERERDKLLAYLQATPKSLTRIYQVINYIRGVK